MERTNRPRINPFVGPRAFQAGEKIYGRERETNEIINLLLADRIVLLHSPSGAGKTSLIYAALMPQLSERNFLVQPVMQVNMAPPGEFTGNRYIYSILSSLDEQKPEDERLSDHELKQMDLVTYFQNVEAGAVVLIFDQFEEILTVEPTDQTGKKKFFEQSGELLGNRNLFALFSMREDYVAGLDQYLRPIPTRLKNSFRLDFLEKEAAQRAIQKSSELGGVEFTDPAAIKLVTDLSRVKVQLPDGSIKDQVGIYVEPVQLQVVCRHIWDNLDPDDPDITEDEIKEIGDVDESLAVFYANEVRAIAKKSGVKEKKIREWFEQSLISEGGIRGQVLLGLSTSASLENEAIFQLEDAHLVRRDTRRSSTWFELTHDRLVQPILQNNKSWFKDNLSLLQRQAGIWREQNRPPSLLLRGQEFAAASEWAENNFDELTEFEGEFLQACKELQKSEENTRKLAEQKFRIEEAEKRADVEADAAVKLRIRNRIITIVGLLAFLFAILAFRNLTLANEQRFMAEAASTKAIAEQQNAEVANTQAFADRATAEAASTEALEQRVTAEFASTLANEQKATAESASMGYLVERNSAENALLETERAI